MHVSKILSDVLLMQKAEEHQFTLEIAPFSMQECVQQTLRMMTSWVENKQITLVLDVAELPLVLGDRFRVRQVIANFLSNALKFTPNGGEILVREDGSNVNMRICVCIEAGAIVVEVEYVLGGCEGFAGYQSANSRAKSVSLSRALLSLSSPRADYCHPHNHSRRSSRRIIVHSLCVGGFPIAG